jgi:hypothetical protein
MSKRGRKYELRSIIITHYLDDHLRSSGRHAFMAGDFGTGKTQAFATIFVEGKSDQFLFESLLKVPHHGSARAGNMVLGPPKLAEFFLLLLPMKYREELIGCAEEEYWTRSLPRLGARRARVIFWTQMIHAWLIFLARPLAGIAGLAWMGKVVDVLLARFLK